MIIVMLERKRIQIKKCELDWPGSEDGLIVPLHYPVLVAVLFMLNYFILFPKIGLLEDHPYTLDQA
jgi:hypothetical protein